MITMYTDGSFNMQQEVGGWAAVILNNGVEEEYFGSSEDNESLANTGKDVNSSQRMEVLAVLEGLLKLTEPSEVEVISDSRYVVDTMNKGWLVSWIKEGKMDKKHLDLWKIIYTLSRLHNLKFTWIKGHSGDHYNERCDTLAQMATKRASERPTPLFDLVDEVNLFKEVAPFENKNEFALKPINNPKSVESTNNPTEKVVKNKPSKRKSKRKGSFYAVAKGRKRGVLRSWSECSKSVNKYRGAIFKRFDTEEEALKFIRDNS